MILSFSEDRFKERILGGLKIHTIRTDRSERWKKGQIIHFWRGNPRNTRSEIKPHEFHKMNCTSVQKIEIHFPADESNNTPMVVIVDNKVLDGVDLEAISLADGFDDSNQMKEWFNVKFPEGFKGRLIHWTKKKY